jgi:hypothetical protein
VLTLKIANCSGLLPERKSIKDSTTVRIRLFIKPDDDLSVLIEQLHRAGIPATGGARFSDEQAAITFPELADTDRAIAWLAKVGIHTERG